MPIDFKKIFLYYLLNNVNWLSNSDNLSVLVIDLKYDFNIDSKGCRAYLFVRFKIWILKGKRKEN